MTIVTILSIVGMVGSIAGFGLAAVVFFRRRAPRKELFWDSLTSIPIAGIFSNPEAGYKLSIAYEKTGQTLRTVSGVYVSFVRFISRGTDSIRRVDLIDGDPLQIRVEAEEVLDISLVSTVREITGVSLGASRIQDGKTCSDIKFEFLDQGDGALIRILSTSPVTEMTLSGTIVGIPQGVTSPPPFRPPSKLRGLGILALGISLFLGSGGATIYAFLAFVSGWQQLWILVLPIAAIIVPLFISFVVDEGLTFPKPSPEWPEQLQTGVWGGLAHRHFMFPGLFMPVGEELATEVDSSDAASNEG